jgi:sugar-specific transcriptional regulator TrmB
MEEKIFSLLRSIGLSRNETVTYLDLISRKESSVREISNRTKLHRANAYEALKGLLEKGFVSKIIQEGKNIYKAENPKKLKEYIKQKEQEIDIILPTINAISQENSDKEENISITRGLFASRNALNSLLEHKSPIDVYGIPSNIKETLGDGFLDDFHRQRIRKRIPIKMVFNHDFTEYIAKLNKSQYTEARHSDILYNTFVMVFTCNDTVLLSVVADSISNIEIRNKDIANAYRSYFNILWENAKKQTFTAQVN